MFTEQEFQELARLIYSNFGIVLGADKKPLVMNRLQPVLAKQNYSSFSAFLKDIRADTTGKKLFSLANELTTNYSFFYREIEHFEFLEKTAIPERLEQNSFGAKPKLNFWSAGCSSGEEPYTISMMLHDALGTKINQVEAGVFASDLDSNILGEAYRGIYPADRLRNVPPMIKMRYFQQVSDGWKVRESVRELVHFSRYNLMKKQFVFKGKFFAIFCRNVMIYFDKKTAAELVERFFSVTEKGGYLFIGQTETLDRSRCPFTYVAPSIYRKD
jgi:chemotaxis protein methyltransferase CheR